MSTIDFPTLRARFPLLDERIYMASSSMGPMPIEGLADLDEYRRTLLLRKHALPLWVGRMVELTGLVEALLGAEPGSVALEGSATAAQAAIASALEPRAGRDRIVLSSLDFHSSQYLWKAQARRGFRVEVLRPKNGVGFEVEELTAAIDERTAVVATALVSPWTGALLDLGPVARAARAHGALTVIDAYQAVGVVPIDVQALGVDVLVGGTHKWLGGGGLGLSFLYVRPTLAKVLEPAYPGWLGHASFPAFGDEYVPAPGARRFQQGSPAIEPIYTARAGLRVALDVGVKPIRERSLALTARLIEQADTRGLSVRTPREAESRGGTVCLDVPEGEAVVAALEAQGIDIDFRPGAGLRIGPHWCQREDECERVIDAIAEAMKR